MEIYDVVESIGRGAFGIVELCRKKHNREKLVRKKISTDLVGEDLTKARNEVSILRSLNHPNVIKYHDSYLINHTFHIVMEYASHGNLQQYLAQRRPNSYLPPQILMGLNHIHEKGIIHRDLKCENIFVTGQQKNVLKIGDFGISKLLCNNYLARTIIGTCNYVAPELCDGKPYGNKTDIWALGCILYEICQLEKMFDGTVTNVVLSIASGKLKSVDIRRYGKQMQELLNLLLQVDPALRPDTKMLMSLGDVFPSLHCLPLNLGCLATF